ncbi:hypothetical protein SMAC_09573 [Paecilomyces variotii No. 5]|uniref:Dienelactone hydrolase domain-containing protein n=1 Tax=Byssochlamys spectabilis (strain No. 5 / NBRC 109023) TaxID=1356009 RepID=V5G199_BYSSN|nr:hypothetical protein SMAC_09573 [Paecilomyces variotii No. 5]
MIRSFIQSKGGQHRFETASLGQFLMQQIRKIWTSYTVLSPTANILLSDVIGHQLINTQLLADQVSANGYLTVVPDLFFGNSVPLNSPAGFDIFEWLRDFPPERIDTVIQSTIEYLKISEGITTIAAAGYCFGGKHVVRFLGKGASVGYAAHRSMVDEVEFAGIKGPLSISAADKFNSAYIIIGFLFIAM